LLTVGKHCPIRGKSTELVADFSVRAARIAAAYARFYLELEPGCNPALKGRFYWMGLAAFASKQVMCGLDFIKSAENFVSKGTVPISAADRAASAVQAAVDVPLSIPKKSLGKGNFWLFQDIYVWHWFYANHPDQFETCAAERNAAIYPAKAKASLGEMPWSAEVLGVINNFGITEYVRGGFQQISKFEVTSDKRSRRAAQLSSLMNIADHEQRMILQPLIYENVLFRGVLTVQQKMEFIPGIPKRLAAFSTACDVEDEELKVQMEEGDLYDENDRMAFISEIAKVFHKLMSNKAEYMEAQIFAISRWTDFS